MRTEVRILLKMLVVFLALFVLLNVLIEIFGYPRFLFEPSAFASLERITLSVIVPTSCLTSYMGYVLARRRNRDKKKWALMCFIFNILGLIYLYYLPITSDSKNS